MKEFIKNSADRLLTCLLERLDSVLLYGAILLVVAMSLITYFSIVQMEQEACLNALKDSKEATVIMLLCK